MLISRPSNSGLKRLINIQKCRSSTKLDHCALFCDWLKGYQKDENSVILSLNSATKKW